MQKIRPARYFGRFLTDKKVFFITPAISIMLFLGIIYLYNYTLIRTIVVRGPKERSIIGLDGLKAKNLYVTSHREIMNKLLIQNPAVKKISVEKIFPDLVVIIPEFYTAIAYLPAGTGYLTVSQDGKILQKTREQPAGLPAVTYYQKINYEAFQSGQTVDYSDLKNGLAALKIAKDLGLAVDSVDIGGANMIRLQLDNKVILFSAQKSMQLQAYQLERLVRQFALEGKDFGSIDVRFEKPVVRFAK